MWDLIVSVPDHCLSFYLFTLVSYDIMALLFTEYDVARNSHVLH